MAEKCIDSETTQNRIYRVLDPSLTARADLASLLALFVESTLFVKSSKTVRRSQLCSRTQACYGNVCHSMPSTLPADRDHKVFPYRSDRTSRLRSPTVTKSLTYSCACHLASDHRCDGEGRHDSLVALWSGMNKY